MCGIFGIVFGPEFEVKEKRSKSIVDVLFLLSESRGKEASGLSARIQESIYVLKRPLPASALIKTNEYRELINQIFAQRQKALISKEACSLVMIGHTRLVTNGAQEIYDNNQPVIKNGLIGIHNGIIVNNNELWKKFPSIKREFDVDTEILLTLIDSCLKGGESIIQATQTAFGMIKGTASVALLFDRYERLLLVTNNGSLYICRSLDDDFIAFASEKHILDQFTKRKFFRKMMSKFEIVHVQPNVGYLIDLRKPALRIFFLDHRDDVCAEEKPLEKLARISHIEPIADQTYPSLPMSGQVNVDIYSSFEKEFSRFKREIGALQRCARCILPETVPFIEFDEKGVCNYCRDYKKILLKGKENLERKIAPFRRIDQEPDSIFMLSGGRDSCYGLHYAKTELQLNPVAYTYDWGLITDLARRNISRMCSALGVEHILVSADINKKRKYVRNNVSAWLKRPQLGLIPLFMAGDKQFFYYANLLGKRFGTRLVIQCRNPYETTKFKSGFCGIKEEYGKFYEISLFRKAKLFFYYLRQFAKNPGLINSSLLDSLSGFVSAYFLHHHFLFLFDHIEWNEELIISTLREKYDWEIASESETTWRIGDGTSAFYNYIYYSVAGFSEHDTFLSNQIREGKIERERALEKSKEQNRPRFEAIQWYCNIIGIDFNKTLKTINSIQKLYHRKKPMMDDSVAVK